MQRLGGSLVAALMFLCVPLTAAGQEGGAAEAAAAPAPAPWGAFCTSEGRREAPACQIEQRVVLSNSGQLLTAVAVSLPRDGSAPVLVVQTPFGLFLPAGLKLAVDDKELVSLALRTCDASGCYADTPATEELMVPMKRGNTLSVTFEDAAQNKIVVPVSLNGFSAALEKAQ
ncbi:MAG TPA: invasion associated locus B family protein [Devosia sp.]|nr:invasion associated locus B family protein [Devosia sp.]